MGKSLKDSLPNLEVRFYIMSWSSMLCDLATSKVEGSSLSTLFRIIGCQAIFYL